MKTHLSNAKMIPIKARKSLRVVMPKTPLKKALKAQKYGKQSCSKGNIYAQTTQRGQEKASRKTQFQKNLSLERNIPQKYEDLKSSLLLNSEGNCFAGHDVSDDAWIHRAVTPPFARIN
jgi:hypothetical protein